MVRRYKKDVMTPTQQTETDVALHVLWNQDIDAQDQLSQYVLPTVETDTLLLLQKDVMIETW